MILAALQLAVRKNDKAYNLAKIESLIDRKADLVALPELFATGYYFPDRAHIEAVAEQVPGGYTTERLIGIARRKGCVLVGAVVEKDGEALHITAVAVGPSGYIGKQRKRHLTGWERQYYIPGAESKVFNIGGSSVGIMVCLEGWFPESARELTLRGAEVICHTALTTQQRTLDIVRVRAMENHVFVALANSCGAEDSAEGNVLFRGDSRIIDINGDILVNAETAEIMITAEVDATAASKELPGDCDDLIREAYRHRKSMYI